MNFHHLPQHILARLTGGQVLEEPDEFVRQHYQHNFLINTLDAGAYLFGISFTSLNVILPLYLSRFTESQIILGMIVGIYEASVGLPQLFMVPLVNRQKRQIPLMLWTGLLPRLIFILISALMLFSSSLAPTLVIVGTLGLLGLFGLTLGTTVSPWQELMAKVIPATRRGRFFGVRLTFGGILSVVGAGITGWVLTAFAFPINFAVCAFITFLGTSLSLWLAAFTREKATLPRSIHGETITLKDLRYTLVHDKTFAFFILSFAFMAFGNMATGFYAVYALAQFALTSAQAGWLNTIWFGVATASNILWGWVNDHFGPKVVLMCGVFIQVTGLVLAIVSPQVEWFYLAFGLASSAAAATLIGGLTLSMIIGPEIKRPLYMGLFNTLRTPAAIAAPLLGGWIARTYNYHTMFGIAALCGILGLTVLYTQVKIRL